MVQMHLTACAYDRRSWKVAASREDVVEVTRRSSLDPSPLKALSALAVPCVVASETSQLDPISDADEDHDEHVRDSREVAEILVANSSDEER